jgi:hypothetical protein
LLLKARAKRPSKMFSMRCSSVPFAMKVKGNRGLGGAGANEEGATGGWAPCGLSLALGTYSREWRNGRRAGFRCQ